ncbi:MAG TPA: carboxypeptidase regulatory-like domain-containing protein [Actinomycetota bacterium]
MRSDPFRIVAVLLVAAFVAVPPAHARDLIPPNDNFADATVVDEFPYRSVRDLALATREQDEPLCSVTPGTIWYRIGPDVADQLLVSVAYAQASLAVFEGTSLDSLSLVSDCYLQNAIVRPRAGVATYVQVAWDRPETSVPYDHVAVVFDRLGAITGRVTDDQTGLPVSGACVHLEPEEYTEIGIQGVLTAADGTYVLTLVPSGRYRVRFGCFGEPYRVEYWNDDPFEGAWVTVRGGAVTDGIDAALRRIEAIVGTVRDAGGTPVRRACINVHRDSDQSYQGDVWTKDDGTYAIGVAPGAYKIYVGCAWPLRSEWYADAQDFEDATLIQVTQGADTTGIDVTLDPSVEPPGDTLETAIAIPSVPFSIEAQFRDAGYASGLLPCEEAGPDLWFSYTAAAAEPLALTVHDPAPTFTVWERTAAGYDVVACTHDDDRRVALSFLPEPGHTYLIQVTVSRSRNAVFTADEALGTTRPVFAATVPCGLTCDFSPAVVCEDDPGPPPGSWDDILVTVPALVEGSVPTHLVAVVPPVADRDLVVCRPSGTDRFVALAAGPAQEQEGVAVPIAAGEQYVIRVFNWADAVPVTGRIGYRVAR